MKVTKELQKKGEDLLQKVITKASNNNEFKKKLILNPNSAIIDLAGNEFVLPTDRKIIVEDQSSKNIVFLNIPRKVNLDDFELSDEQLDIVAGGEVAVSFGVGILVGAAIFGVGYGVGNATKYW